MTQCLLNVCRRGAVGLMVAVTLGCSNGHQPDSAALEGRLADIEAKLDALVGVSHDAAVRPKEIKQTIADQKTWPEILEARLANIEAKLGASVGVSHDADVRLKEIEQTIADQKTWPADIGAAEALRDKLEQIMDGMSPATQDAAIARLWPLRWAVRAFWALRAAGSDGAADPADPADMADELRAVLEAAPESSPVSLRQELERAEKAAQQAMRQQVLDVAKALIKGEETADPAEVWESLQRFADGDQEISDIRDQVKRALMVREIAARCTELRAQHGRIGTDLDEATRQAALTRLYEAAAGYRLDVLLTQPERANDLDDLNKFLAQTGDDLRRLAKSQQERQETLMRQYQKWALDQIAEFDKWDYDHVLNDVKNTYAKMKTADEPLRWELLEVFPSLRNLLAEHLDTKLPNGEISAELQKQIYDKVAHLTHWSYAQELAYRATRDAMVKFLAPIDEHLLDRPVQQLFGKSYGRGWTRLEGRDDQLFVAKQAAVVLKRGLADKN